jgi:hypothetical protein
MESQTAQTVKLKTARDVPSFSPPRSSDSGISSDGEQEAESTCTRCSDSHTLKMTQAGLDMYQDPISVHKDEKSTLSKTVETPKEENAQLKKAIIDFRRLPLSPPSTPCYDSDGDDLDALEDLPPSRPASNWSKKTKETANTHSESTLVPDVDGQVEPPQPDGEMKVSEEAVVLRGPLFGSPSGYLDRIRAVFSGKISSNGALVSKEVDQGNR